MRLALHPRGMTFVELLASMLLLSIVLPVTVGAILYANRTSSMAVRKRDAAFLADQILQEVIGTESWEDGDQSGEFEDDFAGWTWEMTVSSWDVEAMQQVDVTVFYPVQGTTYSETLTRLVMAEEEEES
ncbi:MAG: hypothetical protein PWP23_822 [Candidatus Sumerlaeota bacterium]|nr:hypothetical protein [Candidatus Sumerlaeota bacterium]